MTIRIIVKNEDRNAQVPSETLTLNDLLISIGSGNEANVRLGGNGVASEQAVIVNENGRPLFINQVKGTILNGTELDQGFPHELRPGDQVQIGSYTLTIELSEHSAIEKIENSSNGHSSAEKAIITNNGQNDVDGLDENLTFDTSFNNTATNTNKLEAGTFADILSSLRQEEDQFYFQLTEPDGAKRRLLIQSDETVLGWDVANDFFSTNKETTLDLSQAVVRKDWNGVTIYPSGEDAILLNDALLEAGSRLKDGDKLIFSQRLPEAAGAHSVTLVFCEPAALVELNAILPQQLLSSALETNHSGEITADLGLKQQSITESQPPDAIQIERSAVKKGSQLYFGYFMLAEIIIMIVATILTAALTYLLLEFS